MKKKDKLRIKKEIKKEIRNVKQQSRLIKNTLVKRMYIQEIWSLYDELEVLK